MHPRSLRTLLGAAALTVVAVPVADAQKPVKTPKPPKGAQAVSFAAAPSTIVFGSSSALSGTVSGPQTAGVTVQLDADETRPYGDAYKPTGRTAVTAANGRYSFSAAPGKNTQYRVTARTSPTVTSAAKLVLVRIRVGLRVSDSTPRRGSRVLFSGSVFPAYDGRSALIQKRSPSGRWVTVVSTPLRDAGTSRSSFSRRLRVSRDGTYRVKVSGDANRVNGFSRLRALNVG